MLLLKNNKTLNLALTLAVTLSSFFSPLVSAITADSATIVTKDKEVEPVVITDKATLELQSRLEQQGEFQANFTQTVFNDADKIIQQSQGLFAITKPGKFYWQVQKPEEELLISNGKVLWYYSPFLEQVTIMDVKNALKDTPFLLLAQQDPSLWQQYDVLMIEKDTGTLFALKKTIAADSTFFIELSPEGKLISFSIKESSGAKSEFVVTNITANTIAPNKFNFVIPTGTEIDDQR